MPSIGEAFLRPALDAAAVAADPEYGRVVCFCERVSRGELRDAFASTIPPCDVDGLRRRTRALMGRCQGFSCGAEVTRLLEESLAIRSLATGSASTGSAAIGSGANGSAAPGTGAVPTVTEGA